MLITVDAHKPCGTVIRYLTHSPKRTVEARNRSGGYPRTASGRRGTDIDSPFRLYDNLKFAEDLVRDVTLDLVSSIHRSRLRVETGNQESIHIHAAYLVVHRAGVR